METCHHYKNGMKQKSRISRKIYYNPIKNISALMKKKLIEIIIIMFVLIITLLFLNLSLSAQNDEIQTLFDKAEVARIGGYGTFEIKASQLDGGINGLLLGWRGGVILNHKYVLGLAGYGLLPTRKITPPSDIAEIGRDYHLTGGYGGILLEYINSPRKLLHFAANTLIGIAGITYTDLINKDYDTHKSYPKSISFVVEPCVEMELNVSTVFRMSLGVSYRYSPNFKLRYNKQDNKNALNGLSINLGFKFGEFLGYKIKPKEK